MPKLRIVSSIVNSIKNLHSEEDLQAVITAAQQRINDLSNSKIFIDNLLSQMNTAGMTTQELMSILRSRGMGTRRTLGNKVPPKYRYTAPDGSEVTWSGRGRKPEAFIKLIEQGHSIDEYLIRD